MTASTEARPGSRRAQQAEVASAAGLELVDLLIDPPDPALFIGLDHLRLAQEQWVPWRQVAGTNGATLCIASVAPLGADHLRELAHFLGADEATNLITTDWDVEHVLLDVYRDVIVADATTGLALHHRDLSSEHPWRARQIVGVVLAMAVALIAAAMATEVTAVVFLTTANLVFFSAAMFKVLAALDGELLRRSDGAAPADERIPDEDLPLFTILVPAYREAGITQQLVDNLGHIDYPTSKLQILLLLEEDDQDTIDAFRATAAPDHVHMIAVPQSHPRTKPKACNVGLTFARGEYLVIYDAEDVPDGNQLRSVVAQFRRGKPTLACIQCRLNYHNVDENLLTRMFTLEYSVWFTYMVRGLGRMRLPIPLGGSSNHFRTELLRSLGGWDPHNVTEDADLGMRATALGFQVEPNPSVTMEEACSRIRPWIRQRTRWIKGYMVTFLVHSRRPVHFTRATGIRGTLCLLLLVAGTPAMFLASSVVWAVWLYTFLGGTLGWLHVPPGLRTLNLVVFLVSMSSMIAVHAVAGRKRQRGLARFAPLLPVYWLLHSFAAWRALIHLLVKPDVWEKTPHGLVADVPEPTAPRDVAPLQASAR